MISPRPRTSVPWSSRVLDLHAMMMTTMTPQTWELDVVVELLADSALHDDHDDPQTSDLGAVVKVKPLAAFAFHDGHDDPQTSDLGAVAIF